MKYCPNCGAELKLGTVSFCHECGKSLAEKESTPEPFVIKDPPEKTDERRRVVWKVPEKEAEKPKRPTYDGYYDDIVPEDGMEQDKPVRDKSIALKVGLVIAGVLFVAVICVIALLFL